MSQGQGGPNVCHWGSAGLTCVTGEGQASACAYSSWHQGSAGLTCVSQGQCGPNVCVTGAGRA